jgi:hypothetical protein
MSAGKAYASGRNKPRRFPKTMCQPRPSNVVSMIDPADRLDATTTEPAEREGGGKAMEEPTRIVVYVIDGSVQCVLATKHVEAYVVEHDIRNDHGKHGMNTEICGLPVMLSRRKNVVAPRLVSRVVKAHKKAYSR